MSTDMVLVHVQDRDDRCAVRVQRIGDEVFLLTRADRYAPWSMNIKVHDIDVLELIGKALQQYARLRLTCSLRDSVALAS